MQQGQRRKSVEEMVSDQEAFYRSKFGMWRDFSKVTIPLCPEGFDRLIIVPEGMTAHIVYDQCSQLFPCWKYTDRSLDEAVPENERDPKNGTYAIWVRDRQEADVEHKNKSADQIMREELTTETLLERLLHELVYFKETGQHLDIENVTLCAGSRDSNGDVPSVHWSGDELEVSWCDPVDADDVLRAREVVAA
jgi:hypothetical protein